MSVEGSPCSRGRSARLTHQRYPVQLSTPNALVACLSKRQAPPLLIHVQLLIPVLCMSLVLTQLQPSRKVHEVSVCRPQLLPMAIADMAS